MAELKIKTGTIVTRNEEEHVDIDGGSIQVIPAWRFLIDLPDIGE